MTPLFSYLLQSSIASAICYFFYQFFLRRNTFYRWNRLYFISAIFISSIFPILHLDSLFQHNEVLPAVVQYIPDFSFRNKITTPAFSWPAFAIDIFYAGILMMFARFVIQLFSILLIRKKANTLKLHGISIINTKEKISPFSFFNEIYINPQQHTPSEMEQIVRHEMIHAKQYHSVDILLSEIFTIIFWCNPFAWLLKKALKQNLEFLTDRQVLATGIDVKLYQYCLLKVSGIHTNMAAASHFNFSKLKNRIIMMNKERSSQLNVFKYLLLVPVAAFLLMAFNGSVKTMQSGVRNFIGNDTIPGPPPPPPPDAINIPAPPLPEDVLIEMPDSVKNFYRENETVKIRLKNGGSAIVTLKNGKTEVYDLNNENNRKIFEKKYGKLIAPPPPPPPPPLPPAPQQPPTVSVPVVATTAPVKEQLASVKVVNSAEPVPVPATVAAGNIFIHPDARPVKNSLVSIDSKDVRPTIVASTGRGVIVSSNNIVAAEGAKASSRPDVIATPTNDDLLADEWMTKALYYINGKEVTRDIALAVDPAKIIRMEVYPSTDALKKFGEKGKNGIIQISTK